VTTEVVLAGDADRGRYELHLGGRLASYTEYERHGDVVVMPHTYTMPEFRDRGLADVVVQSALDGLVADGTKIVPLCWFVAEFIDAHPEYRDAVAASRDDR
jgi:predicted GNAT family acetyltransferase